MSSDNIGQGSPNFDSIRQISDNSAEFWSARDLAKLLKYSEWRTFEIAIKRAITSATQVGMHIPDHFGEYHKMIMLGKGGQREVKDYILSRFACYLIAQNGDPNKAEIASAQVYFAVTAREHELDKLLEQQEKRLELRERISENNKALLEAAKRAGVLTKSFGLFQNAGYEGLYGGLSVDEIKAKKGIGEKEDILDRMGRTELAANDFRITQTEQKLTKEVIVGQTKAIETHQEVAQEVRGAIERIGGTMPEDLPTEPSIKPLLTQKRRSRKRLAESPVPYSVD